ncbi:hypothetical protein SRHO_G00017840 [Serrasalmus rhombeus]
MPAAPRPQTASDQTSENEPAGSELGPTALSALKPGDIRGSCVRRDVCGVRERRPAGAARSGFKTLKNSVLLPWIARV